MRPPILRLSDPSKLQNAIVASEPRLPRKAVLHLDSRLEGNLRNQDEKGQLGKMI